MEFPIQVFEVAMIFGLLLGVPLAIVVVVGLSRWHWFVRLSTPVAGASLLIPTGVYPASLYFLLTAGQVLAVLTAARWWNDRRDAAEDRQRTWTFSLRDMFALTALIAAVCGIGVFMVQQKSVDLYLSSLTSSLVVLVATWCALGRSRKLIRIVVACAILIFATAAWHFAAWYGLYEAGIHHRYGFFVIPPEAFVAYDAFFGMTVALCVIVFVAATYCREPAWLVRGSHWLTCLLVGVAMLLGSFIYYRLVRNTPIPAVHSPSPNGQDHFIRAGELLLRVQIPDQNADPPDTLASFVNDHRAAFSHVRSGLDLPSLVPLVWEENPDYFGSLIDKLRGARQVACGLRVEAIVYANTGNHAGAAQSCVDCIHFAHEWSRGGLVSHFASASAIEDIGTTQLRRLRPRLDSLLCRTMSAQLVEVNDRRESVADIKQRDGLFEDVVFGWYMRLPKAVNDLTHHPDNTLPWQQIQDRDDAIRRLLITELAVQAYALDHGSPPRRLDELVPEYLARVPLDPYDNLPLRFKLDGTTATIYSVGPDRDDDGGTKQNWTNLVTAGDSDFLLDPLTATPSPGMIPSGTK